jgi:catechol 2,3-dioxygenase
LRESGERGSIYADRYASNRLKGANPRRIDHVTYMVSKGNILKKKHFGLHWD